MSSPPPMAPMTREALEALEASIKHWEENVAAKTVHDVLIGARSCALCVRFISQGCIGCPVFKTTGEVACRETPYDAAHGALERWRIRQTAQAERKFRQAAQAELDFLRSLLPPDIRCPCCYGRGYQPERRRSGRGFYARTCRSCGGRGQRAPRTKAERKEAGCL